jgi:hypothetical protein
MRRILNNPIAALVALALIATAMECAYVVAGVPRASRSPLVLHLCWAWPVLIWMDHDAHLKRRRPCYDFGLFLMATFPLSVVWYCFWARGRRGLKLLLGLACLLFLPVFVASLLEAFVKGD